jgi:hypothetical protein
MLKNPAETHSEETPLRTRSAHEKSAEKIDRRVAVAPMMDWTDEIQ